MDIFTLLFWIVTIIAFLISLKKSKEKTINSIKTAKGMMKGMVSQILAILFLIGLILTLIPPNIIKQFLGESNYILSTLSSAFIGSITLIPAFVAFPLIGSFISVGASIVPAIAFLTTLTMVGFVTFPLEKQEFGLKFALFRNLFSFIFAIIIAIFMGMIL